MCGEDVAIVYASRGKVVVVLRGLDGIVVVQDQPSVRSEGRRNLRVGDDGLLEGADFGCGGEIVR